jgi:hypothetical protein
MIPLLRKIRKPTAIIILVVNLFSALYPTISYALTSGPTAPEATSFEPVDTTDMVNLATGDFTYNIPLLEVPGPAGGYPLSLSYHAGIQPNEDASWVGLGWTLNPGAISRTVNGYPDDQVGAIRTRHDFNNGGTRNTYSLGIGVPGAMFGLSISNDSNLGLGIGTSFSVGPSFQIKGTGIGIGADYTGGNDGYGNSFSGVGVNASIGKTGDNAKGLTANIGISTNFNSVSAHAGVGFRDNSNRFQASLLGASISSNGLKPSLSVAGYQLNQTNGAAGRVTTESWGISTPPIPIGPFTITLGYNYLRYYSDETANVKVIGSVNTLSANGKNADEWSFDSYALLNPDASGGVIKNNDPEKSRGGSFPSYDSYNVNAQGLGGSIQPYILDPGRLFRQNLKKSDGSCCEIKYETSPSGNFSSNAHFRFKNDFSNSWSYESAAMKVINGQIQYNTVNSPIKPEGFNSSTRRLAGSKHIEFFSNEQINNGFAKDQGFVDYKGYKTRELTKYGYDVSKQIGGFMITNESGITYHYSLPVYSYFQVHKTFVSGKEYENFQNNAENHPFAYTWFLTAVTGPDYINRNGSNDGTTSTKDWGYWVKFTYSMKTDEYVWRNPDVGTHKDINLKLETYSYGQKELYYLDKIETSTHVALFNKSERVDGRGVTGGVTGGYNPMVGSNCHTDPDCVPQPCTDPDPRACGEPCQICDGFTIRAAKTLKLDKIVLLSRTDFNTGGDFSTKAMRVVNFQTDYSLAQGTSNSFVDDAENSKLGKLTLNSLRFLGKGETDLIPPIRFEYARNPAYNKDAYDIWGQYKSDYKKSNNDYMDRLVSQNSSANVDAWSLSQIMTSTGSSILISYESDEYKLPILYSNPTLYFKTVSRATGTSDVVNLDFGSDVSYLLQGITKIDINALFAYPFKYDKNIFCSSFRQCPDSNDSYYNENQEKDSDFRLIVSANSPIISISGNMIGLKSKEFFEGLSKGTDIDGCHEYNDTRLIAGFVKFEIGNTFYGGGLRVKKVTIKSNNGERSTSYNYNNLSSSTSGVTSYEPQKFENQISYPDEDYYKNNKADCFKSFYERSYRTRLFENFTNLFSFSREIPAPGVIYGTVTVEEEIQNAGEATPTKLPGKKVYEFQTFDESMVQRMGLSSADGLQPSTCYSDSGKEIPCDGDRSDPKTRPVRCYDQNGSLIDCNTPPSTIYSPVTFKDFSSWVGSLKSVTTYGTDGSVLDKIVNHYLHENKTTDQFASDLKSKFNNQGVITQLFSEVKTVGPVFTRRDEYPLVATGQTSENNKSGIKVESENLAFNFYTGKPTKVLNKDGYGNSHVSESVPAYTLSTYSGMEASQISSNMVGMGLKINNPNNKHMLTQEAGSYTFKVNDAYKSNQIDANKIALVSATAQTWSNQTGVLGAGGSNRSATQPSIWRMKSSFSFIGDPTTSVGGDGLLPMASYTPFNAWSDGAEVTNGWQKNSEIKLFDIYSHALEATDVNQNYAATIMSQDQTRVLGSAANAQYDQIGYSGAEEQPKVGSFSSLFELGNNIYCPALNGATWSQTMAHTGTSSMRAALGQQAFYFSTGNSQCDSYHVSLWSSQADGKIKYHVNGGAAQTASVKNTGRAGNWYLLEADISGVSGNDNVRIWCEGGSGETYFDDFRVHPQSTAMTSYVYNSWGELSHILDNNNLYTKYIYDEMGRLKETYKESFRAGVVKTSDVTINYGTLNSGSMALVKIERGTGLGIIPSTQSVVQGGSLTIVARNSCSNLGVSYVVDGIPITGAASFVTLYDGGRAYLDKGCRLQAIVGSHTVKANFEVLGPAPDVRQYAICETYTDKPLCFTGRYILYTYGLCGWDSGVVVSFGGLPSGVTPPSCTNSSSSSSSRVVDCSN